MKLPHPEDRLAGCCWLPRIAAKCRVYLAGALPLSYRVAFGNRVGVDGFFLRHFKLTRPRLVAAVRQTGSDEKLAEWFLRQPAVNAASIARWNEFAPRLGAAGHTGRFIFQLVRPIFYPKTPRGSPGGIFEAIVYDEDLPPLPPPPRGA